MKIPLWAWLVGGGAALYYFTRPAGATTAQAGSVTLVQATQFAQKIAGHSNVTAISLAGNSWSITTPKVKGVLAPAGANWSFTFDGQGTENTLLAGTIRTGATLDALAAAIGLVG